MIEIKSRICREKGKSLSVSEFLHARVVKRTFAHRYKLPVLRAFFLGRNAFQKQGYSSFSSSLGEFQIRAESEVNDTQTVKKHLSEHKYFELQTWTI